MDLRPTIRAAIARATWEDGQTMGEYGMLLVVVVLVVLVAAIVLGNSISSFLFNTASHAF